MSFLVLPQHEPFYPEGLFVLGTWESGLDKVSNEIHGLSMPALTAISRTFKALIFYFKFKPFQGLSRCVRTLNFTVLQCAMLPIIRRTLGNLGNFCLWNPEPGFGIRNTAQGIRYPTNDWNPESKFYWQILESSYLESGIHGVESRIQDSPGFHYMGRNKRLNKIFLWTLGILSLNYSRPPKFRKLSRGEIQLLKKSRSSIRVKDWLILVVYLSLWT